MILSKQACKPSEELVHPLQKPNEINTSDVQALHSLVAQYPYFQLGFTLIAKAAYDQNPHQA